MDDADRADTEIEHGLAEALRIQRQRAEDEMRNLVRCIDCDEPLESHRRPYGLCVPCKVEREIRDRRRAVGL
jgi:hypothetical protein